MRFRATAALVAFAVTGVGAQRLQPFVPIGVVDDRPGQLGSAEIAELRKLRFTVVARRERAPDLALGLRARRLPGPDADPGAPLIPITIDGAATVSVREDTTASQVRRAAWILLARGYLGVIFDGWTALHRNPAALKAAADFADVVTRNPALFAPLRASSREVRLDVPSEDLFARFVESPAAMVLVAANMKDSTQRVTLSFLPETPEAIWQNMESGAAVNFVAGPDGPTYTRTFLPHDVMVLMIRKQYK